MAQALGYVTKTETGGYEGTLATMSLKKRIRILPNSRKESDAQPDFRVFTEDRVEVGGGWNRVGKVSGNPYVSLTFTELRAQRNYAGHRLAPWLAHVMVSRQETARPLLTPGEVMQLPADEEVVMISGQPPIRAKKLRYFEDANFTGRVSAPPDLARSKFGDGAYPDSPPPRPDDWSGQVRGTHADLVMPWSDLVSGAAEEEGGLKRHPSLPEEAPQQSEPERAPDAGLLDDEFDPTESKRMDQLARNSAVVRRAHAMDQADDDLIPRF